MEPFEYFEELNNCLYLLLEELGELETNVFRIRVVEGRSSKAAVPIEVAGQSLGIGHPIEIDSSSVRYELTWYSYVLYQVTNESFGCQEISQDGLLGRAASVYRSSSLLNFVVRSSNASDEYPGKLAHFRIVCGHHVVDVISTDRPECRRISAKLQVN
jgi:hypothetical protein